MERWPYLVLLVGVLLAEAERVCVEVQLGQHFRQLLRVQAARVRRVHLASGNGVEVGGLMKIGFRGVADLLWTFIWQASHWRPCENIP